MATFITIAIVMAVIAGVVLGAFLRVSFAISREDRTKGSLRLDPPSHSARAARTLVGVTSSRWD